MLMSCMLLQTAVRARDRAAHSKQALAFAAHPERLSFAAGPCSAQACHVMRAGCLKLSLSTPPQSSLTHVRAGSAKPRVTKQGQMDQSRCRWLASSCRCLIQSGCRAVRVLQQAVQQVAASSPFSAQLRTHECAVVQLHPVNLPSVLKNQFLCGCPRGQEQCGRTAGEADLLTPMAVS